MLSPRLSAVRAGTLLVLSLATPAMATITPHGGDLLTDVESQADTSHIFGRPTKVKNWTGQRQISNDQDANSPAGFRKLTVTDQTTSTAHWAEDALSGDFHVTNQRSIAVGPTGVNADRRTARAIYTANWDYHVSFDKDTTLSFTYDISGADAANGQAVWSLSAFSSGTGLLDLIGSDNADGTHGMFTAQFGPGDYFFSIDVDGGSNGALRQFGGDIDAGFTWQLKEDVSAVPETRSWALMLGGFGMVGGTLRARRRTPKAIFG